MLIFGVFEENPRHYERSQAISMGMPREIASSCRTLLAMTAGNYYCVSNFAIFMIFSQRAISSASFFAVPSGVPGSGSAP